jgi:NADP-dependent 3-hydroxy acid dehydrogenase YdfG
VAEPDSAPRGPVTWRRSERSSQSRRRRRNKLDEVVAQITGAGGRAIPASSGARAIDFAIEQPADVDINEIVVRPTAEEF